MRSCKRWGAKTAACLAVNIACTGYAVTYSTDMQRSFRAVAAQVALTVLCRQNERG